MRNLAIVSGLWGFLAVSVLACDTNRKGLGTGGPPDGGAGRGGTGSGGAAAGGNQTTGGLTGGGGVAGQGGASVAGGGGAGGATGTGGRIATGGVTASGGRAGTGGVTASGGSAVRGGASGGGGAGAAGGRSGSGGASVAGGAGGGGGIVATGGGAGGTGAVRTGGAGGASASGGVTGSGGATGGAGTTGTAAGGASGSGGTSGGLRSCTSSDGSGCDEQTFCVDTRSDACLPDSTSGCTGLCAGRRRALPCADSGQGTPCPDGFACIPDPRGGLGTDPVSVCVGSETRECTADDACPTGFVCVASSAGRRCSPDRVVCEGAVVCKMAEPAPCPVGYARSTPDGCYGPCVPVELCACATDAECATAGASCDRKQGRCYTPRSPEPGCQLAFDVGPCDAAVRVFAFTGGECKAATYGGCGGNDNRFSTLEECLGRCQGMPGEHPCPEGRVEKRICLGCGAGGGCLRSAVVCAQTCGAKTDCQWSGFSCASGYCEAAFCI